MVKRLLLKDQIMHRMITRMGVNCASFVSYGPDGKQRHCCIRGIPIDQQFPTVDSAVQAMYNTGYIENVNIRCFTPEQPDGHAFFYGPKKEHGFENPRNVAECVKRQTAQGLHVIVNETIDVNDGGFSGVALGNTVEFAACDTPRCVDKEDALPCAALSRDLTRRLVRTIYDTDLIFPKHDLWRLEFTVSPSPVGYLKDKLLIWQAEEMPVGTVSFSAPNPKWPNRYSCYSGDKVFGLIMADIHDFPVPYSRVWGRVIPPFSFGTHTHSGEGCFIRTCPKQQVPGKFTTKRGYKDPFTLLADEDPDGTQIASYIYQDAVRAGYSGSVLTGADDKPIIEGKEGGGEKFMLGEKPPTEIPRDVTTSITSLWGELREVFGPIRLEWVYERYTHKTWVVQLHIGQSPSHGNVIFDGEPNQWHDFYYHQNLEELRKFAQAASKKGFGINLFANIGITAHPADILRLAKVPSKLFRPE